MVKWLMPVLMLIFGNTIYSQCTSVYVRCTSYQVYSTYIDATFTYEANCSALLSTYLDVSVPYCLSIKVLDSSDWDRIDIVQKGDLVWTESGQVSAKYPLVSAHNEYHDGYKKTLKLRIYPSICGEVDIYYRGTLVLNALSKILDPIYGTKDQQNYPVYVKTVTYPLIEEEDGRLTLNYLKTDPSSNLIAPVNGTIAITIKWDYDPEGDNPGDCNGDYVKLYINGVLIIEDNGSSGSYTYNFKPGTYTIKTRAYPEYCSHTGSVSDEILITVKEEITYDPVISNPTIDCGDGDDPCVATWTENSDVSYCVVQVNEGELVTVGTNSYTFSANIGSGYFRVTPYAVDGTAGSMKGANYYRPNPLLSSSAIWAKLARIPLSGGTIIIELSETLFETLVNISGAFFNLPEIAEKFDQHIGENCHWIMFNVGDLTEDAVASINELTCDPNVAMCPVTYTPDLSSHLETMCEIPYIKYEYGKFGLGIEVATGVVQSFKEALYDLFAIPGEALVFVWFGGEDYMLQDDLGDRALNVGMNALLVWGIAEGISKSGASALFTGSRATWNAARTSNRAFSLTTVRGTAKLPSYMINNDRLVQQVYAMETTPKVFELGEAIKLGKAGQTSRFENLMKTIFPRAMKNGKLKPDYQIWFEDKFNVQGVSSNELFTKAMDDFSKGIGSKPKAKIVEVGQPHPSGYSASGPNIDGWAYEQGGRTHVLWEAKSQVTVSSTITEAEALAYADQQIKIVKFVVEDNMADLGLSTLDDLYFVKAYDRIPMGGEPIITKRMASLETDLDICLLGEGDTVIPTTNINMDSIRIANRRRTDSIICVNSSIERLGCEEFLNKEEEDKNHNGGICGTGAPTSAAFCIFGIKLWAWRRKRKYLV